jgi:hypothetical protein
MHNLFREQPPIPSQQHIALLILFDDGSARVRHRRSHVIDQGFENAWFNDANLQRSSAGKLGINEWDVISHGTRW